MIGLLRCLIAVTALILAAPPAPRAQPAVAVSIKPLHSLVAGVMAGVADPALLVAGAGSPHDYALRPSEAAALTRSILIFYVSKDLERFIIKYVSSIGRSARTIALIAEPGLLLWPRRDGSRDPHLWLDPANAKAIAGIVATAVAAIDPGNAPTYRANAQRLGVRIDRLDRRIAALLRPVRDRPFLVYHDAYQYFTRRYGLNAVAAITVDPERPPGARRLRRIQALIREKNIVCLFAEPQFPSALLRVAVEGTTTKIALLDPLGAAMAASPDAYFQMMEALAHGIASCLTPLEESRQ